MKKNIIGPIILLVILIAFGLFLYLNSPVKKNLNDPEMAGRPITSLEIANAKGKRASLLSSLIQSMNEAVFVFDATQSYKTLCKDGILDTSNNGLNNIMNAVMEAQGVSNKFDAGLTCISNDEKYVISVKFNNSIIVDDLHSYCMDSLGNVGYNSMYVLDADNISCLPVNGVGVKYR